MGPHEVDHNVVVAFDETGANPWVIIKSECYAKGRGFRYHHNLFWVESAELYWNEKEWPQAWLSTFEFRKNVFVFTKRMKRPTGPHGSASLFIASDNVLVAPDADPEIRDALLRGGGTVYADPGGLGFVDPARLDFGLKPGSPLADAGPFGPGEAPGPDWPRPRRTVFDDHSPRP